MFDFASMLSGIGGSATPKSSGMKSQGSGLLSKFKRRPQQQPQQQSNNMFGSPGMMGSMMGSPNSSGMQPGIMGNYNPGIQGGMVSPYSGGGSSPYAGTEGSIANLFAPRKQSFFSNYFGG